MTQMLSKSIRNRTIQVRSFARPKQEPTDDGGDPLAKMLEKTDDIMEDLRQCLDQIKINQNQMVSSEDYSGLSSEGY